MPVTDPQGLRHEALKMMLRPLVRFCLKGTHTFQDFMNIAKVVFVEVAADEIAQATKKINSSRISVMTGLNRLDVTRIFKKKELPERQVTNLLSRIIGQWEQDARFVSAAGRPRALSCEGEQNEFRNLVEAVSKHMNPGTVLFELERTGSARRRRGMVKLLKPMARFHKDPQKAYQILGKDIQGLTTAVEENVLEDNDIPNLHIRTEYDNIFVKDIPLIRAWLLEEGAAFHKRARDFLSQFDQDINPKPGESAGAKVVVGAFGTTSAPKNND